MPAGKDTPAMRQYRQFKERYPDCILFFRMGDFYELFHDDAITAHKALGITLTQRTEGVPMAGVPYHSVDGYLRKMIQHGFRVAICEQVQDPKEAKGVVARAVTRVLTPGTLIDESLLDPEAPNHLAAIAFIDPEDAPNPRAAVGAVELSTGEFEVAIVPAPPSSGALDWLARRSVRELLVCATADDDAPPRARHIAQALAISPTPRPAWHFRRDESLDILREHFKVAGPEGFGFDRDDPAIIAIGVLIRYLRETQAMSPEDISALGAHAESSEDLRRLAERSLAHLRPPRRDEHSTHLIIDAVSLRALEIERTVRSQSAEGSLLSIFSARGDAPATPMGRRLLRDWLTRPLADRDAIESRQAAVAALHSDTKLAAQLHETLSDIQDVPRMIARVALGRAAPRDLVAIGKSVARVAALAELLTGTPALAQHARALESLRESLQPLAETIARTCIDDPPAHLREGGLIRTGIDPELDEARTLERDSQSWLAGYQTQLIKEHDLPSLKVGYTKVFGYYIELPAAQARRAPSIFTRKQTLKNAERYITPELKTFEDKVLSATDRAIAREQQIFTELCRAAAAATDQALRFAAIVAETDALACFARRAVRMGWTRPDIVEQPILRITEGRHPVLEELLADRFVANDVTLGIHDDPATTTTTNDNNNNGTPRSHAHHNDHNHDSTANLALITGPNMSGKSTFIRQVALITLLAHAGSFVPAAHATIGLTDRIFTRIGADDALHAGQSTFMVEMIETANILHHATSKSLIVLDEIGRGTSTLDGLSLAWAIVETLATPPQSQTNPPDDPHTPDPPHRTNAAPRTLFATHYHELTTLAERLPGRIRNLHVQVREWGEEIVFLHRILPGAASRSYGIQVARLAGLPRPVVQRADELLKTLSVSEGQLAQAAAATKATPPSRHRDHPTADDPQLTLFTRFVPHPAIEEIKSLQLDRMSPMDAFDALRAIMKSVEDQSH
ncbi:MAG: DNA mismatch repair protein MutS [Phycisphaerales bacterium]